MYFHHDLWYDEYVIHGTAYSISHQRRSGGHAIISWLAGHFSVVGHSNSNRWGVPPNYRMSCWILPDAAKTESDGTVRGSTFPMDHRCRRDSYVPSIEKDLLVISYEDPTVSAWTPDVPPRYGRVAKHRRILVLRSFYNVMASRLQYQDGRVEGVRFHAAGYKDDRVGMWIENAEFALKPHGDTLVILYDLWVTSPTYRRLIEKSLGLREDDSRLEIVPPEGGGSSFDKRSLRTKAQKMDVNARWRAVEQWPSAVLESEKARELNRALFGWSLDSSGKPDGVPV